MGKKKSKKGKFKSGTWVDRELFTSRAFLSLKGVAPQLLILFFGKRDWNGKVFTNTQKLTMPYIERENIFNKGKRNQFDVLKKKDGISSARIKRGIEELLAKGFIKIVHQGGAYKQDKSIYALSENWRIWHKGAVFEERPIDKRTRGYRKPKLKVTSENGAIHT